jgi:hypothetical protein
VLNVVPLTPHGSTKRKRGCELAVDVVKDLLHALGKRTVQAVRLADLGCFS